MLRPLLLTSLLLAIAAACASSDPEVPNFGCGGFAGYECPPATSCDGPDRCSGGDCGGPCLATTPCTPSNDTCPNGTSCDAQLQRCMPRACKTRADCKADEFCIDRGRISHPICGRVDGTAPSKCTNGTCPFPWSCVGTICVLGCPSGECPSPQECNNGICGPKPL